MTERGGKLVLWTVAQPLLAFFNSSITSPAPPPPLSPPQNPKKEPSLLIRPTCHLLVGAKAHVGAHGVVHHGSQLAQQVSIVVPVRQVDEQALLHLHLWHGAPLVPAVRRQQGSQVVGAGHQQAGGEVGAQTEGVAGDVGELDVGDGGAGSLWRKEGVGSEGVGARAGG